jgi:hypothetical protein
MAKNMSTEKNECFKDSAWGNYLMLIWNGAIIFLLIDILFALITVIILYSVMNIILFIGKPWNIIPEEYLDKSTLVFCILYIFSIVIVSWCRHFSIIKYNVNHNNETTQKEQKSVSSVNSANEAQ